MENLQNHFFKPGETSRFLLLWNAYPRKQGELECPGMMWSHPVPANPLAGPNRCEYKTHIKWKDGKLGDPHIIIGDDNTRQLSEFSFRSGFPWAQGWELSRERVQDISPLGTDALQPAPQAQCQQKRARCPQVPPSRRSATPDPETVS